MKTTKLLTALAVALLCFSCAKQNKPDPNPGEQENNDAFLSLNLMGTSASSAMMTPTKIDPNAGSGQDYVNDVHILYFDADNKLVGVSEKLTRSNFTITASNYRTTSTLKVPVTTKKVFVIVNNFLANGTTPRFVLPTKADNGKLWSALNPTISYTNVATETVNDFIENYVGKQGANDNYAMANYGVRYIGTTNTLNPNDNGLVDIEVGATDAEAKSKNNIITIDRLSSKIEFKIAEIGTAGAGEITAKPVNSKFFFKGWELNATNRHLQLYTPHDVNFTGANINGVLVAYRKDLNYPKSSYGEATVWDGYKAQFVYLKNVETDGNGVTSPVNRAAATIAYSPENTMEANAQVIGATTKVAVKGNYVPAGLTANSSYFSHNEIYYTLDQLKTAYAAVVGTGGLVKDMNDFMKAAGLALVTDNDVDIAAKVAALTPASFDATTGIRARMSNAVRYFHEGISYYETLIRHDYRVPGVMTLGKYGVVRNNWYTLTLNTVSQPGTPWIPGGPTDPTTPPETPDDNEAILDVTIVVNPWVSWNQNIDL